MHGIVGVVTGVDWTYGTMLGIKNDDGTYTLFAHMSVLRVQTGDVVTQGQEIGLIGSTGQSTGPHLHFELYLGGAYGASRVNPELYYDL